MKFVFMVLALFGVVFSAEAQTSPGDTFRDCDACPLMVVIPAGSFNIGSPEIERGHESNETLFGPITFASDFAMGAFEVTNEEWSVCADNGGCNKRDVSSPHMESQPVTSLTKSDMMHYLAWITQHTDQTYRLPSETEWEYAARAGTQTPYNTGDTITNQTANILVAVSDSELRSEPVESGPMPVGSFQPNSFGLYDMHGNVSELVADCYSDWYGGVPKDGSPLSAPCIPFSIHRGGSWRSTRLEARSASRGLIATQDEGADDRGFRVVRTMNDRSR